MAKRSNPELQLQAPRRKIELYSGTYFGACALGGVLGTADPFRVSCRLKVR